MGVLLWDALTGKKEKAYVAVSVNFPVLFFFPFFKNVFGAFRIGIRQ